MREKAFYQVSAEFSNDNNTYQHREIEIWIQDAHIENGKVTLKGYEPTITLRYQRGTSENPEGKDATTQQIIQGQKLYYYAESVEDVSHANAEVFSRLTRLFARMEKVTEDLREQGLTYERSNDSFLYRKFLLSKVGQEVEKTESLYEKRLV